MRSFRFDLSVALGIAIFAGGTASVRAANALTPEQALAQGLTYSPVQTDVEYTIPSAAEAKQCTIQMQKETPGTAWVVRNPQGQVLRRFADTNNDGVVDVWCYYQDSLEVYRDIDSNFNRRADQYRWFNTAGTRWAIDRNEDGRIDAWRVISPHEVAEQLVLALRGRDPAARAARFNLLLPTPDELNDLGLGKQRTDELAAHVKAASEQFAKLAAEQKIVTPESRYVDFGSARPATIPIGTGGSTNEVRVCDNGSALVQTAGKAEQINLGPLVAIGDTWKLVDLPSVGSNSQPPASWFNSSPQGGAGGGLVSAPNEEMQKLLDQLEQLDAASTSLSGDKLAANIGQRADALLQLAKATSDADMRNQFYNQLVDVLSVAIQTNTYPQASARLDELQKGLTADAADEQLVAHVAFQSMWAKYIVSQAAPDADAAKIQEKWLTDLAAFVKNYPKSSDAAEALLQLGMFQEFVGKTEEARKWYQQLATDFPNAPPATKAKGALRRLNAVGSPVQLRGKDLKGGTVDLAGTPYRGKVVLIQYWATWSDNCKSDMVLLKDLYAKRRGADFEILGVCLDANPAPAIQFLREKGFAWNHIYEQGGVDGRLADEMGVMTLPLMILVDRDGKVVNNNIHVAELETELSRLQKAPGETANTLRTTTPR